MIGASTDVRKYLFPMRVIGTDDGTEKVENHTLLWI